MKKEFIVEELGSSVVEAVKNPGCEIGIEKVRF